MDTKLLIYRYFLNFLEKDFSHKINKNNLVNSNV